MVPLLLRLALRPLLLVRETPPRVPRTVAAALALMRHNGRTQRIQTKPAVAVCICGLERTLLSWPVVNGYARHLFAPHAAAGHQVDNFLVLVGTKQRSREATNHLLAAYNPAAMLQLRPQHLEDLHTAGRCSPAHRNYSDDMRSLTQWLAIRHCYHRVQKREAIVGFQYTWIYRMRTDIVLLADTPIAALPTRTANMSGRVYVPMTGMSGTRTCEYTVLFCLCKVVHITSSPTVSLHVALLVTRRRRVRQRHDFCVPSGALPAVL